MRVRSFVHLPVWSDAAGGKLPGLDTGSTCAIAVWLAFRTRGTLAGPIFFFPTGCGWVSIAVEDQIMLPLNFVSFWFTLTTLRVFFFFFFHN